MIKETIKALGKNNMKAFFAENKDAARKIVMTMIQKDDVVGAGGSMTLDECGIRDVLRQNHNFLDWFVEGIDNDTKNEILAKTMTCTVFLTSSNAITLDGKLYNTDGRGNRLGALVYGPDKVIVVAGRNKIVKNLREAKERMETTAAPQNAKRLNKKTPCVKTGCCEDCDSPERICCHTVITERQYTPRISVIIVDEDLGL